MRFFAAALPGPRVLVAGCGDGRDSRYLALLGLRVISFDLSDAMLAIASARDASGDYRKLDLRDLSGLRVRFDGVHASGCLYHLTKSDLSSCIDAVRRLLGPDGVFYLNLKEGRGQEFRSRPGPGYPGGAKAKAFLQGDRFYSYYRPLEMRSLFERFTILRERPLRHAERVREFWLRKPA